jgi:hypothetical protein
MSISTPAHHIFIAKCIRRGDLQIKSNYFNTLGRAAKLHLPIPTLCVSMGEELSNTFANMSVGNLVVHKYTTHGMQQQRHFGAHRKASRQLIFNIGAVDLAGFNRVCVVCVGKSVPAWYAEAV